MIGRVVSLAQELNWQGPVFRIAAINKTGTETLCGRIMDALEARLGVKLFQRHARGYAPTEAGEELARVAQVSADQFSQAGQRKAAVEIDINGKSLEVEETRLVRITASSAAVAVFRFQPALSETRKVDHHRQRQLLHSHYQYKHLNHHNNQYRTQKLNNHHARQNQRPG